MRPSIRSALRSAIPAWLALSTVILAGCGGGTQAGGVGAALRPEAETAAGAVDGPAPPCREIGASGQPLVVDWPAHERVNLEEAMMQGVAVVSYSCEGLRLLPECRLEGSYGFLGLTRRDEVVQLVDADEIHANLPGYGSKLIVDVGADLERGRSLDLAIVLAGKARTTLPKASRAELRGSCEGATHFVRGAFVGAFAMTTGTRGSARSAAQIFGAGASAASESQRLSQSREGEPKACDAVEPGDAKAPRGCRSAVRLELIAIGEAKSEATPPSAVEEMRDASACPAGLVRSGGKCTEPAPEKPYQCSGRDPGECETQCGKGSHASCFVFGLLSETGQGIRQDYARAAELYGKACSAGIPQGCNRLGVMHFYGNGAPKDAPRAVSLFAVSCRAGLADGCSNLGFVLDVGRGVPRDSQKAAQLFVAACNGGDVNGCFNAGVLHAAGRGVPASAAKADGFFERAQQGGVVEHFKYACGYGNAYSCFGLGHMHQRGLWLPRDEAAARKYFEKSCPGVEWGCEALGRSPTGG